MPPSFLPPHLNFANYRAVLESTVPFLQIYWNSLEIAVIVRSAADLARIVKRNPLRKVATNPKRYQVTFLAKKLPAKAVRELEEAAAPGERVVVEGREVYAWHAEGIARSKLWSKLAAKSLGVTATSRNWSTVKALHELAASSPNRHRSRTRA